MFFPEQHMHQCHYLFLYLEANCFHTVAYCCSLTAQRFFSQKWSVPRFLHIDFYGFIIHSDKHIYQVLGNHQSSNSKTCFGTYGCAKLCNRAHREKPNVYTMILVHTSGLWNRLTTDSIWARQSVFLSAWQETIILRWICNILILIIII